MARSCPEATSARGALPTAAPCDRNSQLDASLRRGHPRRGLLGRLRGHSAPARAARAVRAVVERAPAFDAKVGEATTEMSAMFLTRRLAMWNHLEVEQLPKEGLRYWFSNEHVKGHADASETGGFLRSAVPSFQLRRDALDEHLLATAVAEGATPGAAGARGGGGAGRLRPSRDLRARRPGGDGGLPLGARRHRDAPPSSASASVSSTGTRSIRRRPCGAAGRTCGTSTTSPRAGTAGSRTAGSARAASATNHYMGFGYWIWVIPLGHGETSIGVVYDTRLIGYQRRAATACGISAPSCARFPRWPSCWRARSRAARTCASTRICPTSRASTWGAGWALLGDAAAFLDPYYSPGLDHAAFSRGGHHRDDQGRPGGRAAGRPHRRAQRHLRALLPPLLPGGVPRQVLLHGRAGSPLGLLPHGHRAVLPLRRHSRLPRARALLLDAGARARRGPPSTTTSCAPTTGASRRSRWRAGAWAPRAGATTGAGSSPTSRWTGRPSA